MGSLFGNLWALGINWEMIFGLLLVVSYLLGCINPAIEISRRIFKSDIRGHGSGNAGSTNMFRTFGRGAGIATQVLDIGKASLASALPALWLLIFPDYPHEMSGQAMNLQGMCCGLAAVIGHIWPVLYQFKGGKGVNSLLGTMIVVQPFISLISLAVFLVVIALTRYVSLGSMLATAAFPVYILITEKTENLPMLMCGICLTGLMVFTHRENIGRLLKGKENKIGKKKQA